LAVLVLAAALRTWRLAEVPPGLHHDEAFHLLRAEEIARGEALPIYIPDNQGNEPLFAYFSAVTVKLLGSVNWAGRLAASWAGLAAVALTVRAGREMFPRQRVGEWAGLLLAVLFWHLDMSRWGSQPILSAAAAAGTMAGLWRGARTGRPAGFVFAGGSLAAGLWSYAAFRVFPLAAAAGGLFLWATRPTRRRAVLRGGAIAGLTAALLCAPLGVYFARHPEWFFNRFSQVTQTTLGTGSPIQALAQQAQAVLAGLVVAGFGDQIWRHNIPGRPGLDPVQATLVVIGLAVGLARRHKAEGVTLIAWAMVGLLPAVLTEYPPQHGRSVMATPALALLGGLGADAVWRTRRGQPWTRIGTALAVTVSGGAGVQAYFGRWANDPALHTAFDVGLFELGQALKQHTGAVLYETPVYREYPTLEFALEPAGYERMKAFNGRACLVVPETTLKETYYGIVVAEDRATLSGLQAAFPDGEVTETLWRGADPYAEIFRVAAGQQPRLQPDKADSAWFDRQVALLGHSLGQNLAAGERMALTLYWQKTEATAADLHVFVHVLGPPREDGSPLYAQRDGAPCDNAYPTWQWAPGEIIVDRIEIEIPADVPAGEYQLSVGWYDIADLTRLEAIGPGGESLGNAVALEDITVAGP
jgi:hypothetical protein